VLRRPPRFALVLSALVAGAAVAVLLLDTGSSPAGPGPTPTVGLGPSRACVHAPAQARVTARSAIVVTITSQAPIRVTQQATGPRGAVSVTQGTVVTAHERFSQPVAVTHVTAVRAGACANAGSSTAARDLAERRAASLALAAAHADAAHDADTALRNLMRRLYPSVLRQARAQGAFHARQLGERALPLLTARALAEARRQAGG
jgi:hypothetical protein